MYFPDRGRVHALLTPSVYATGLSR